MTEETKSEISPPAFQPLPEELAGLLPVPDSYVIPMGYKIGKGGVWAVRETKDGSVDLRVAWAPLVVSKVFVDQAGDQTVELAWLDGSRLVTRIVPRSLAKRGKHLVAALGDAGLPVIDADARLAERWLAAVESVNRRTIERKFLARSLGWQVDGAFVTSQDAPHRVEVKFEEQKPALAAHRPCGTLAGWQTAIKRLEGYQIAQIALYTGFAAPLLDVLGLDSFALDLSGRSTRGKTTAAMAGLSVWADPSERGDGTYSWRTTMLAAEKRLNLVRGLPVLFDETKLVREREFVHSVIYQLPKNHGQPRGGGWPSRLPWRTILISTGEQPLLSYTSDQGAGARVVSVQGAPFGTDGTESADAAIEVRDGCTENYGVAGPAFIGRLLPVTKTSEGRSGLLAHHHEMTKDHQGSSDLSARRAPLVACLRLAAELAHKWGVVPFPPPAVGVWNKLVVAREDLSDDRPEMALEVVREYVASQGSALWSPHLKEKAPFSGWIGRELQVEGQPTVGLLAEKLRECLKAAGYDLDAVVPGWREKGVLVENTSYRPPYLLAKRLDSRKPRMYVFSPGHIASAEFDDED